MNSTGVEVSLFLGGAGQFSGLGCPKCPHSPKALNHLSPVLASLTFLQLDIFHVFFWIAWVLLVPILQRTWLIVSFSTAALCLCSYQTHTIECTALFWLKDWLPYSGEITNASGRPHVVRPAQCFVPIQTSGESLQITFFQNIMVSELNEKGFLCLEDAVTGWEMNFPPPLLYYDSCTLL